MRLREYLLLAALSLLLFAPGLWQIPPLDRDEPRFAEASRQMLVSRDFVDIRFQDEARLKKPAGIYWLQAASAALFSTPRANRIWPYRLPSTLGAVMAVLLTAAIGAQLFGRTAGWTAGLMMVSCLLLGVEARLAKTDAVLLATTCAAQLILARAYLGQSLRSPLSHLEAALFWIVVGIGILVKGPIIVMVSGLTAIGLSLWDRHGRWLLRLRPWPYVGLSFLVVAPWITAIMLHTKGAFLSESVGHDLLGKVAGAQEAHGAPPGFFFLTFWATFWPFSFLAAFAAPWVWRHREHPAVRFCLCWLLPSWIVFELVPTKLPHYTLPLFPAIALLTANAATAVSPGSENQRSRLFGWALAIGWIAVTAVLCAGLPLLPALLEHRLDIVALGLALAALILFVSALRLFSAGRWNFALAALLAGCIVFYGAAYSRVMPELHSLWISNRIAAAVKNAKACPASTLISSGFSEPSLVFLLGPETQFGNGRQAAEALLRDPCSLALVDRPSITEFTQALAQDGRTAQALTTIEGINTARGKKVDLTLFRLAQAAKSP